MKELFSSDYSSKNDKERNKELMSIIDRLLDEKEKLRDEIRRSRSKNGNIKESELKSYIRGKVLDNLTEDEELEQKIEQQRALNKELERTKALTTQKEAIGDLESDYEDTLKMKDDSIEKKAKKLAVIHREKTRIEKEMRSIVRDYKKSDGAEKQGFLNTLKDLNKKKKDLDSLIKYIDV